MSKNEFTCDCSAIHQEDVLQVQKNMPDPLALSRLSRFYRIIADPTRCKLLWALKEKELCVCDLACLLSMTKSSVSHQLKLMRQYGLVKCRRSGKEVFYSLDDDHVHQIFEIGMLHICHQYSGGCDEI